MEVKRISFGELTKSQVEDFMEIMEETAADYGDDNDWSGLSTGSYNLYHAIQNAILREWHKARNQFYNIEKPLRRKGD